MGFASWMAYRYLTAKKDKFLAVINGVAIAGIAIGVAALIIVIGVMSGFDHELREKIIGANAHVLVERETGLEPYAALQDKLKVLPGVVAATPYIHGNVFLESGRKAASLILRGVQPQSEGSVTRIDQYLAHGAIKNLKPDEAVIGSQMASFYGLRVGDDMTIIAPASGMAGDAWRYHFKVAGLFTSGMYDYDRNLVLVDLRKAQEIFHIGTDTVTGIGLKLRDPQAAGALKKNIYDLTGFSFSVRTWMESNSNFFAALQLEKFAMFIILILIVLVASFNIISTLIVTVTGKVRDIGILKAIGASKGMVGRLFMWQGLVVGMLGTFWGFTGGVGLSLLLKKYQFIRLPQDIYYIDHLPVLVQASDVAAIVGAAMLITYAATVYPAMKAADLEPVEALRY
ncbi:MAG: ABC transporter permease [Candidatus Omnitrophica bacterium]|nr:ABC transporter permease [Candidatus Omnitrophota bacterium]